MLKRLSLTAALCLCIIPAVLAAPAQMRAGKWQTDMGSDMPGEKPSTFSMTQCMTKEQLDGQVNIQNTDSQMQGESDGCKFTTSTKGGNTVMEMRCGNDATITTINSAPESYSIRSVTTGSSPGTVTMTGKRVGDC